MLSTGVDIVAIARIEHLLAHFGERFLSRVYTPEEIRYSRSTPSELAARFAAKEAVSKALGVGMAMLSPAGIGWHEAEVRNDVRGKPYLILSGKAQHLAQSCGLTEWSVSLSHDEGLAVAFVVAIGTQPPSA